MGKIGPKVDLWVERINKEWKNSGPICLNQSWINGKIQKNESLS
jgi:hypothetical protein